MKFLGLEDNTSFGLLREGLRNIQTIHVQCMNTDTAICTAGINQLVIPQIVLPSLKDYGDFIDVLDQSMLLILSLFVDVLFFLSGGHKLLDIASLDFTCKLCIFLSFVVSPLMIM